MPWVFNKHWISLNCYQLKINWSKVTKIVTKLVGFCRMDNENNAMSI